MVLVFNVLLIDCKKIKVYVSFVDLMICEMGDKYLLIVFLEGGRSMDGEMGEFKSGFYYLGKKCLDIELVLVYIDNFNCVFFCGEFLFVLLLSCILVGLLLWLELGELKMEFLMCVWEVVLRLKEE